VIAATSRAAKTSGLSLAAYPIYRALTDLNVRLNGNGKSVQPWETVGAFNHTHDSIEYRRLNSFPSQPDNYNNIDAMGYTGGIRVNQNGVASDTTLAVGATPILELEASPDSPYATNSASYDQPRCKFPVSAETVVRAANGTLPESHTVTYTITEPLLHPFFRTNDFKSVLSRISSLDVDLTFGNLRSMFVNSPHQLKVWTAAGTDTTLSQAAMVGRASAFAAGAITAFDAAFPAVTFEGSAYLVYRTFVPTVQVPMVLSIPYVEPVVNREPVATFTNIGDSQTVNTRSYQLSQVPHKILIYARPRGQFADDNQPEAFLRIDSLQFRTSADSGGLAGATNAQLFQISQRNGLNMTYNKFSRDIGSIVVLDLERGDIAGYVPGTRENFSFDLTVKLTNTQYNVPVSFGNPVFKGAGTAAPVTNWDLYIVSLMDSKMILDGTMCTLVNGENQELVKQVLADRPVSYLGDQMVGSGVLVGGRSGWQKFVRFINGAAKGVGDVLGMGRNIANTVGQARSLMGKGMEAQPYPGAYGSGLRVLG
jgi:hypothetical protein